MRSKVVFLAVLFSTVFVQSASAAIITYQFTASFRELFNPEGEIQAPGSYYDQGKGLSEISGRLRYDDNATPEAVFPGSATFYLGFSEILLDQFSTADPELRNSRLITSTLSDGTERFAPQSDFDQPAQPGVYNSIRFFFFGRPGTLLTNFEIPANITLSDAVIGIISLESFQVSDQSIVGSFADFNITSLERVEEVPVPGAMVIFLAGFGALAARSKSLFLRK